MKTLLAAGAIALAAGTANAAVIRYSLGTTGEISYATRYAPGGPKNGVDVSDEYAPTYDFFGGSFTIDTELLKGNAFTYHGSAEGYVPSGVSDIWTNVLFEYDVTFDENWDISDYRAYFDDGGYGHSWVVYLGGGSLYSSHGSFDYVFNPDTGKYEEIVDFYGYDSTSTTVSKEYLIGGPAPAPVPLPAAGFLMLAGIGTLGAVRVRRKG